MNICYQCGHTMVSEEHYLAHKGEFTVEPKFNHYEHIIQNALYGRLKPNNILCKQCGGSFSSGTDKDFVSLFQIITETSQHRFIKKDHGKGSINTLSGFLFDKADERKKKDVRIRENIVTPKDPFYDYDSEEQVVYLYANRVRSKQYEPVVRKELERKGINTAELTFKVVEDVTEMGVLGIFFSQGVEDFHQKFTMGFCKIAVGFATYHKVDRNNLKNVLKIDASGMGMLVNKGNIFPFFPVGMVDAQLELIRPDIERHYPSHTLILFSQKFDGGKKHLYCYIDLFSTFQYYVLLNDDYTGPDIYHNYYQAVAKEDIKEPVDVRKIRHKYLNIVVSDYKIDTKKFKGADSDMEAYLDFLQAEIKNYSFAPALDLEKELYDRLEFLMSSYVAAESGLFVTEASGIINRLSAGEKRALLFELQYYLSRPDGGIEFYRKNFLEDDGSGKFETMSTPVECGTDLSINKVRSIYCTGKFEQMSKWIFENRLIKDDQQD
ncbi:hypothetical protein [Pedobacter psychrodurus]|uniref:hypothetical protein n=1 Tax=Pedobacter psychrodurus TaxID=2530456 RepID=UPI00292DE94A|nr:hypothetical protein [Pedobacter psychrodurus]